MTALQQSGLARLHLLILRGASEQGLDLDELMRAAGLTRPELADPDARVDLGKLWALWRAVIDRSDDPYMGLHWGERVRVHDFGLVGYTMANCETLALALHRLARYSHIVSEALAFRFEPGPESGRLMIDSAPRFDALRHPVDTRLAGVLAAARELTGRELVPLEVRIPYEEPVDPAEYQRFFRCPLRFDSPATEIVFRDTDLALPIVAADDTLRGYLEQHAEAVLRSLPGEATFATRVRRAVWDELGGGQPTLRRIAFVVGVSTRTLQRKLREEGTAFADVLDDLRQEMALRLLRDRKLAIYEVAFLLGYSEPSTFHRAFRRWRGVAPHEFRRASRSGPAA